MATRQEARAPVQELFSFMKLPVELRLRVYREVLQTELRSEQQVIIDDSGICGVDNEVYDLHPNILQTCRQVHDEAMEVLYDGNTFMIQYIDRDNPSLSRVVK